MTTPIALLSFDQLQCVNGKWRIRNKCGDNQFCTCTGSHDLICKTNNKLVPDSVEDAAFEDAAE